VWRQEYVDRGGRHRPHALVALHHSREDTDILCEIIAGMARYYGNCFVVPEVNGQGGLHVVKLLVNTYKLNVYRRMPHISHRRAQTEEQKIEAYGWSTDKLTRKYIIDHAVPLIRLKNIEVRAPEVIEEFQSFIVTASGNCEASSGSHDDHVISACIALYNIGAATEYRLGQLRGVDISRLGRDPYYMSPDGFRRLNVGR